MWDSTYPSLLDSITVLQKKILKIITFNEITAPAGPLFDSLQILKLNDLFQLQVASFVYECIDSLAPIYFRNYFISIHTVHGIGTRQAWKGDLYALRYNTTQYGISQFIILVFASGTLYLLKSKHQSLYRISGKKLKSHFLSSYK